MLRVGELMRHALAEILASRRISADPVLAGHTITIARSETCPPIMRHATVYVMPLGGKDAEPVVEALESQQEIPARRSCAQNASKMRYVPDLRFAVDEPFDEATASSACSHPEGRARSRTSDEAQRTTPEE